MKVTVAGLSHQLNLFTYQAPVISDIQGDGSNCVNVAPRVEQCATAGGGFLTINGNNFGARLEAWIALCSDPFCSLASRV